MKTANICREVLTLEEAAKYLRLPPETVKREVEQGSMPGRQVGRTWRFLKSALDDWLRGKGSRASLLPLFGALADDETLPELRRQIQANRDQLDRELRNKP